MHQIAELYPAGDTPPGIVTEPLYAEELVAIVARQHPLAERTQVSLRELRTESFISFKPGSGLRPTLLHACAVAGFTPRITIESSEVSSVRALVAAGLGVALLPRSAAEVEGPPVQAVTLTQPALTRTVSLAWHGSRHQPAAVAAFLTVIREHFGQAEIVR